MEGLGVRACQFETLPSFRNNSPVHNSTIPKFSRMLGTLKIWWALVLTCLRSDQQGFENGRDLNDFLSTQCWDKSSNVFEETATTSGSSDSDQIGSVDNLGDRISLWDAFATSTFDCWFSAMQFGHSGFKTPIVLLGNTQSKTDTCFLPKRHKEMFVAVAYWCRAQSRWTINNYFDFLCFQYVLSRFPPFCNFQCVETT